MSLTKKDRIIRSVSGITVPPGGCASAIAAALRREYGATHASVKTVVSLTGANERAVKNWFDAKNAPSAEFLVALSGHSGEVFETFLLMAGRVEHVKAKKIAEATSKLREILMLLERIQES
jgi:hypothetical protein